jgi:rod shape-determining protein MreB
MIGAIKIVLQDTPPELAADIIDKGITMTGGTSQLRNLPELIFRKAGVRASLADHAPLCVARGTGITLSHLNTYKKSVNSKK